MLHELSLRVKGSNLLTTDKPPNAKISQTLIPLCPLRLRGWLIRMEVLIGQKLLLFVLFSLEITMTKTTRPFTPDWVSSPGDAIAEFLEERDWTQAQLAERLGYTTKHISLLINGKARSLAT